MIATLSRYLVVLACLIPLAQPALAADAAPNPALAAKVALYNKAWLEKDPAARARLLEQVWAKQGRYQDPTVSVVGPDALSKHIGQFLGAYPKAQVFATSNIDSYGSVFRANWRVDLGDGVTVIDGQDVGTVDADGRISAITGFFGTLKNPVQSKNELVAATYLDTLFNRFDADKLSSLIAKDARYNQAPGLPYGGTFTGFAAWMGMFQNSQNFFTVQAIDKPVLYTDPASGRVIATFSVRFSSRKGKWETVMPIAEWFDVKDGLITAITPYYFDTKALSDLIASDK